jgi:catechol-2,3-dioxygenase
VGAAEFVQWQTHLGQALGQSPRLEDHQVSKSIYFNDLAGNPFEITTYELPLPG